MIQIDDATTATNFTQFVKELTALTRKYDIAIQAVGGIYTAINQGDFAEVTYSGDVTSGDLLPIFPEYDD